MSPAMFSARIGNPILGDASTRIVNTADSLSSDKSTLNETSFIPSLHGSCVLTTTTIEEVRPAVIVTAMLVTVGRHLPMGAA